MQKLSGNVREANYPAIFRTVSLNKKSKQQQLPADAKKVHRALAKCDKFEALPIILPDKPTKIRVQTLTDPKAFKQRQQPDLNQPLKIPVLDFLTTNVHNGTINRSSD